VKGEINPVDPDAPKIMFQVALPAKWNEKALMFGGGGFNGRIPNVAQNMPAGPVDQPTPLGRGMLPSAVTPVTRPANIARRTARLSSTMRP
jgi:hypothetical protein